MVTNKVKIIYFYAQVCIIGQLPSFVSQEFRSLRCVRVLLFRILGSGQCQAVTGRGELQSLVTEHL